jgi:hypothetical protein
MKNTLCFLFLVLSSLVHAQGAGREYPMGPLARLTPGELCDRPSAYRYPENIAYCERSVSTEEKDVVFAEYRQIGYKLSYTNRSSYKIDHFIPLCAGGSNNKENLWPQHISIATVTDSIEKLGCDKMALGKLSQARMVFLIKAVKNDLGQVNAVRNEMSRL